MYDIEFKNISVYFGKVCALKDINVKVKEKEFLAVIGPNGGGKTTLLKVLLGLVKPTTGKVIIKGDKTIGYIPQFTTFNKDFPISVQDVVLMGRMNKSLRIFHKYSKEDMEKTNILMEQLGIYEFKDRQIGNLSGGQIQKVLIARALASEPDILVLDEPTASLDADAKTEIYELLKEINKKVTIIIVSHDLIAMSTYVDSIACLNKALYYHGDHKVDNNTIKKVYGCPVELIAHGVPHRVLDEHEGGYDD